MRLKHEKDLLLGVYLDQYKAFLTEKQAVVATMYYAEDMSLAEVANELNVTRQGALDTLTRARRKLYRLEEKLRLVHSREEAPDGL